jgi:hypothetical protein
LLYFFKIGITNIFKKRPDEQLTEGQLLRSEDEQRRNGAFKNIVIPIILPISKNAKYNKKLTI